MRAVRQGRSDTSNIHVRPNSPYHICVQLQREPRPFPTLHISESVKSIEECTFADLKVEGYKPHGKIAMKMAV